MEILLKKYFWVINLLVVGTCAAFAGRAAGHMIEGAYLTGGDDLKAPPRRVVPVASAQKTHDKTGDAIVTRDIFCSGCMPAKATTETAASGPQSNEPQKTTLQLELVSTMVCPADESWSMAVIRDLSTKEKDPAMYNKGASIAATGATVVKVLPKRVYLRNAGHLEYVEMEGATPPAAPVAVAQAQPAIDPSLGDIDKGVNCSGNSCTVDRAVVEHLLQNTTMLATAARFVPSIKDGKPNGFKLYAIRPQSIFGRIGLQNGDTIKAINGSEMTTPDAALGLYTKLRNASHLSVQVERRGETVTLDYTIR
jgi:general secretion pathway protein C